MKLTTLQGQYQCIIIDPPWFYRLRSNDVNDDYHPSNCIWILKQEQARNTRKNKLNIEAVQQIKNMASQRIKQQDIAKKFNISQTMVSRILLGKSWSGI
jgi:predicted XRE-type DNA-binding protein